MPEGNRSRGTYTETTNKVRISATPEPIEPQSDPVARVFAFAYTIRIENLGDAPVQLLERHWKIYSGDRQIAEVVGPGVVGVQPKIVPGGYFEYQSSAVIHDPIGSMEGSYTFKVETPVDENGGEYLQVSIPRFDLLYSVMLH